MDDNGVDRAVLVPVEEQIVGVGRRIRQKSVDGRRLRRQPGEVEGEPAGKRDAISLGIGREPLLLQPGENEPVDRRL